MLNALKYRDDEMLMFVCACVCLVCCRSIVQIASVCFLNGGLFAETHRPLLIQKVLLLPSVGTVHSSAVELAKILTSNHTLSTR